ncbi:MAG TPA: glycosyltransferase family 4 protein [Bryobacteraceae bacterium]|nr:glycosyltransferase family 4 protein [Bryobacteraceae bacterium]HOQ47002.1 glycosyltransferase family 4 protein [Bryobacteraceae bacterium]HPQ16075.1 glycosyltransferase family 4 protein [Bryobacteraceae bacterium]HPU73071.1 glycosyltransferase family 4 protein [Bryobacteraceae bacterium]
MRLAFLTATPLDVIRGSGTFSGISTLARALRKLGCEIHFFTPEVRLPVFTLERLWFNEQLRRRDFSGFDAVVGFDMDGYRVRSGRPHVASIKGVIADEARFERGLTRRTMLIQAACERAHVHRAGAVITTSRYAAGRIRELYGLAKEPQVVPELIDLDLWRELFARNPAAPDPRRFTVLTVCRFYRRKRLNVLLEAAARLRGRVPELELRIVGGGPERRRLHRLAREAGLGETVRWLGDVPQDVLAREYQSCDVFCLPSVQEGFGIVFLEAMAAGKPIVAARAAAAPEVVPHGLLVEPENAGALADALFQLRNDGRMRAALAEAGLETVRQYDAPRVARLFLDALGAAAE